MSAADPEFGLDLDHPEASGIGSPPRPADFSVRAMVVTSYRLARRDLAHTHWAPAARAGELLDEMSLDSALDTARAIARTLEAIKNESADEEAAGAAATQTSGSSEASPSLPGARAPAAPPSAPLCSVCGEILAEDPHAPRDDRWSWGPDGLHCHFRCEDEFNRVGLAELRRRIEERRRR